MTFSDFLFDGRFLAGFGTGVAGMCGLMMLAAHRLNRTRPMPKPEGNFVITEQRPSDPWPAIRVAEALTGIHSSPRGGSRARQNAGQRSDATVRLRSAGRGEG